MLRRAKQSNSILAVDFGSINTRAILIDLVDGQYRLLTRTQVRTTSQPPMDNILMGLSWALENLEATTQRALLGDEGIIRPEQNGQGIDELVVTSSAGRPLSAVILGLTSDISINSARRALNGTYINVAATVSVADELSEEERINRILEAKPDLLFISGGMDGGNQGAIVELLRLASLAVQLFPVEDERPIVLYAGNSDLADKVQDYFSEGETQVYIAKNIRSSLVTEDLTDARLQLTRVYAEYVRRQSGGFDTVASWTKREAIIPTAQSVGNMVRWLGEDSQENIVHLDIGSATSTLAMSLKKEVFNNIYSDLGMGHSILNTVQNLSLDRILTWLPFELSEEELLNYAYNKVTMPDTIPETRRDLLIEYALAREIARYMLGQTRQGLSKSALANLRGVSSVITAGAVLTETPHHGISAMLALDVLELEGVVALYADNANVMAALGAIAYTNPTAAVQVFDNQGINYLGMAFCPPGIARRGRRPAMRIQITLDNGRVIDKDLMPGELWTAPLPPGQTVQVEVRLGRGLRIYGKRRIKEKVVTGTAGIIFDLRGRPLPFVPLKTRANTFAEWWAGVTNGQVATLSTTELAEEVGETLDDRRMREHEIKALQVVIVKTYQKGEREAEREAKKGRRNKKSGKRNTKKTNKEQVFLDADLEEEMPDWEDFLR